MSETTNTFLIDLNNKRKMQTYGPGCSSIWELESHGATIIEPTAFEPDPNTYRHDYYYNAIVNTLYKKVTITKNDKTIAKWHKVSD